MPYAIVTGATHGIGKAIAERFIKEGLAVAICARNAADLHAVQLEWKTKYAGSTILAIQADLSVKQEADAFCEKVLQEFSTIDVVVNNAGIYFPGTLAEEPDGQLESLMAVNLYSAYNITRQLLPVMKKNKCGHIFNMCSVASLKAYPNGGAYSITKYALLGFSDNLRYELMHHNIKVTSICPGATQSRSWENSPIPSGRIMEAADVADTLWAAYNLSGAATIETIVMRPQLGDL